MAKKTDPNQLDIFAEENKQTKLQEENVQYEKRKASINRDISTTEEALKDPDILWQDQKEYESDLRQYERDLEALEREHTQAVARIMAGIER